ncbi:MAG: hypothetical protein V3W09_03830 [Nitrososphaerales archaeon]
MNSLWFKEERELPKAEQAEAVKKTTEVLKNSTIFQRKLDRILTGLYEETLRADEDFVKPNWEGEALANASRRKTLREIRKLIELR